MSKNSLENNFRILSAKSVCSVYHELEVGKINIDVKCTIIKVVNFVETNRLLTEKSHCVKGPDILSLIQFC